MKPWRQVAIPHKDVQLGSFQEAEFAADITAVFENRAKPEYQDPELFYSRTYVTEGMRLLLDSVIRRLSGQGGDPVIQLQTAFGGGKTHTMLAVLHLAQGRVPASKLNGIPPILDEVGVSNLPQAKIAVIDGINFAVSEPKDHGDIEAHTLWGELAWQLGGESGYAMFQNADQSGTAPAKDTIEALLKQAGPCVILMDELVAFYRNFQEGKAYSAGTFESNMTFIQALTEAIKGAPQAILLASLPDSNNAGEGRGQVVLNQLESYFRRLQKIWKPVSKDEAFSIVRKRLFEDITDVASMEECCKDFADYYIANKEDLPSETQEADYLNRMKQAYPIHPEIFDRLYEDWSMIPNFQRTRGVLQLLALIIHRLWKEQNQDAVILPGALPLTDASVRNKCLDFLPNGWEAVIDKDVDGERAYSTQIDTSDARFGSVEAARRLARTIFLGSAPSTSSKTAQGIDQSHLLLGTAQPGQVLGHYKDALKRLLDRLNHINEDKGKYWLDIRANLRREMEARKQRFKQEDDLYPEIKKHLQGQLQSVRLFAGVHTFASSVDVPDEVGPAVRLVVLSPNQGYAKGNTDTAVYAASEILTNRGNQPRIKQNRLLFLAPDLNTVLRLEDSARVYLAWDSIVSDIANDRLTLDNIQAKQAKNSLETAKSDFFRMIRECYRFLLCPVKPINNGRPSEHIHWESVLLSAQASLDTELETQLKENEWMIGRWGQIHLKNLLEAWYFKNGVQEVSAKKVWQDMCQYIYLPKLKDDSVFIQAIERGIMTEDFFGYADDHQDSKYVGFQFGSASSIDLSETGVLISQETAAKWKAQQEAERKAAEEVESIRQAGLQGETPGQQPPVGPIVDGQGGAETTGTTGKPDTPINPAFVQPKKLTFYRGEMDLNSLSPASALKQIEDEIIRNFYNQPNASISVKVEIEVTDESGFSDNTVRAVRENSTHLKLKVSEFE